MASTLSRRTTLQLGAGTALAGSLARPAIGQGNAKVLRFVPHANLSTPDPTDRLEAVSGGYNILGSVTASFRSSSTGNPTGGTSWTIVQTSGKDLSGTAYVYCLAPATP